MKNKKVLNICLLTFGLLALFTFILPIKKYEFAFEENNFVNVIFYLFNAIMIVSLLALVVMAIINLFKDNYALVKLMEIMALVGVVMMFLVLLIFACSSYVRINVGYLLVALEMFACANFSQVARLISSGAEIKQSLILSGKTSVKKEKNNYKTNGANPENKTEE